PPPRARRPARDRGAGGDRGGGGGGACARAHDRRRAARGLAGLPGGRGARGMQGVWRSCGGSNAAAMEGVSSSPFGGDPEDLMRGLREFAEQQAESVAEAQREQFATLTLNTAVELTAGGLGA